MTVQPESAKDLTNAVQDTTGTRGVMHLVAVGVRLVRALDLDADVFGLLSVHLHVLLTVASSAQATGGRHRCAARYENVSID
eukprot:COSAG02_NODE_5383_length_4380_cov_79.127073_3_plen_82_part_00